MNINVASIANAIVIQLYVHLKNCPTVTNRGTSMKQLWSLTRLVFIVISKIIQQLSVISNKNQIQNVLRQSQQLCQFRWNIQRQGKLMYTGISFQKTTTQTNPDQLCLHIKCTVMNYLKEALAIQQNFPLIIFSLYITVCNRIATSGEPIPLEQERFVNCSVFPISPSSSLHKCKSSLHRIKTVRLSENFQCTRTKK